MILVKAYLFQQLLSIIQRMATAKNTENKDFFNCKVKREYFTAGADMYYSISPIVESTFHTLFLNIHPP